MHPDVVGVLVERPLVAVGDQHLRTLPPDHRDQTTDRFLERCVGEIVGVGVGFGVGHPGIAVAEEVELGVSDGIDARPELGFPDRAQVRPDLRRVSGRVENVAFLAAGTTHEHAANALGCVARHGPRALRRFVVGVRVHRHETQRIAGEVARNGHRPRSYARRSRRERDRPRTDSPEPRPVHCCHAPAPVRVLRRACVHDGDGGDNGTATTSTPPSPRRRASRPGSRAANTCSARRWRSRSTTRSPTGSRCRSRSRGCRPPSPVVASARWCSTSAAPATPVRPRSRASPPRYPPRSAPATTS